MLFKRSALTSKKIPTVISNRSMFIRRGADGDDDVEDVCGRVNDLKDYKRKDITKEKKFNMKNLGKNVKTNIPLKKKAPPAKNKKTAPVKKL